MRSLLLALALLPAVAAPFPPIARGQDRAGAFASVGIEVEQQVRPYRLVRLEATGDAEGALWFVVPLSRADGVRTGPTSFAFCGPPGVYDVFLVGLDADGRVIGQSQTSVTIGDGGPAPPPDPDDPAPPDPDEPEPDDPPIPVRFPELEALARTEAGMLGLPADADALARNFEAAAVAASGAAARADIRAIADRLIADNRRAVEGRWDAWVVVMDDLGRQLDTLEDGGKLGTAQDWAAAYAAIARGLRAAGGQP